MKCKGRLRRVALARSFLLTNLKNVAKLKLPYAATVDVAYVEITRVEPEIVESCIGNITCAGSKLVAFMFYSRSTIIE
jgi:hypothetical protein